MTKTRPRSNDYLVHRDVAFNRTLSLLDLRLQPGEFGYADGDPSCGVLLIELGGGRREP